MPNNTFKTRPRPRLTNGFVFKSVFGGNPDLCKELLEITLDTTIDEIEFVQPERELDAFLQLVAGKDVSGDSFVDKTRDIIESYITNPTWMEQYMTFEDEVRAAARAAAKEAAKEAREKALKEGYDKARADLTQALDALDLGPDDRERILAALSEQ